MIVFGSELVAEPADILILLRLFYEMDTNPHQPHVPRKTLLNLVRGKSVLAPEQVLDSFQTLDSAFLLEEKAEGGTQESREIEFYYTLSIEGLRWLFSNTHNVIETANGANWEFPDHLIAKLWSRRIQHEAIENKQIPGADRFVSVKDNQVEFDEIFSALTTIKNEFAEDHYKQTNAINTTAVVAEIEAFEVQIRSGWVSRPAAQNLLDTLKYIESVCVSSSKIVGAIAAITASLTIIFGFVL